MTPSRARTATGRALDTDEPEESAAPAVAGIAGIAEATNAWYRAHARDFPWRRADTTAWATMLIEVLSQQTQIERAGAAWAEWLERWPTPADLAATPPSEALKAWGRLGYPRRALALHAAATAIVERHAGEVPAELDALLALPGVGSYTAAAIASFAYGVRTPVVDTNVRRVLARAVAGQAEPAPPSTRRDAELMLRVLPEEPSEARVTNAAMMELGALVCTPRSPRCGECPITASCAWRLAGYPAYEGPRRTRQARFEGSDRQVRGRIMKVLREAEVPVPLAALADSSPDAAQLDRAISGLVADGLAVRDGDALSLP